MSIRSRRALLLVSASVTLACIAVVGSLQAQVKIMEGPARPGKQPGGPPGVPQKKQGYDLGSLTLPKDDDLKEKIEAAIDRIKEKDWKRACDTLQALVGRHEDVFVPITRTGPAGDEQTGYVSVKKEAARLISTMPKPGRDMYETTFGERASGMVKRARTNNDRVEMAQAMSLYLYTESGADAANWLGTYHLDRAEFQAASRYYQQLINRGGIRDLKPRTLLKAGYAFHQAGDKPAKEEVFKELERRSVELKLREEARSAADLEESINRMVASISMQAASDSPIYRGRPTRTAMLPGGTPFLEPSWKQPMISTERTRERIKLSENALASTNQPILTTFVPVTATMTKGEKKIPLLIYRTYWGVKVVNMRSGKIEWDSPSDWSLDTILGGDAKVSDASAKIQAYTNWLTQYQTPTFRPQIIFENSVLSTVSADSKNVYAIEDLAIPPPQMQNYDPRFGGAMPGIPGHGPEVSNAILHNKLQAFDLNKEGKLAWEVGGRAEKDPLADTYFLGAPLPINGRLYVLTEKQQEIRLAALDPANGRLLGVQTLAATKFLKLSQDPTRRVQACHLAYGEGILVVPTNAGAVFGVDLLSNSLLWAYPYRVREEAAAAAPNTPNPGVAVGGGLMIAGRMGGAVPAGMVRLADGSIVPQGKQSGWMVTAPSVAEGKVVFTAPDAPEVHCVNLRDGSRLWSLPRETDDLYLAGVFNGKVVIVGKKRTRAVSLTRGEKLWELDTGVPAGQGAAAAPNLLGEVIYYLPIREAINTREPEICSINLDRGIVHAHTRSRKKEVPGNLIFYEGSVLSQTHTEVVAYPQLEIKLAEMDRLVKSNPSDPVALTERGDYLLDKGELGGAITDFRKALGQPEVPEPTKTKARTKLYEAFTEYFQRDFAKAEEYIKEYEEICKIDLEGKSGAERTALEQEARRRRANFLCLVGKGREGQNRLVEAFEKYLELGVEAKPDELIQVVDEPAVKAAPDVWSQGRIAAMVANAQDARQRQALEDLITQRWAKLRESRSVPLDDLRKFVSLFGSMFGVGKEARLALAERLMEDTDVGSMLEAEQQLSLLRNDEEKPEIAARAIEALARLNTRKGLLEDAAYYYRLLGERDPKVKIDGRSGEEFLDDLATDKRFLPYLDQAGRYVIKGKAELHSHEDRSYRSAMMQTFQFAHLGEALPFFHRNKVSLQTDSSNHLRLTDVTTGEERWKPELKLTNTEFRTIVQKNHQSRVKFGFQTQGHLVVLQLGHMAFGVDPLGKGRVLWEKNLSSLPGSGTAAPGAPEPTYEPKDNSLVLTYSDGWTQRLGESGPLQGGVVCLQMRDQLTALDPVSGRTLWIRTDVNSRTHVFGDQQHIYAVNMSENNTTASGTRVFRAYDGVLVKTRDFSDVFQHRVRVMGRNVLTAQTDPKGLLTVRLYDVLKGQDLWKQTYPAGTIQLTSEDPRLAGVAETNGTVRVMDVTTGKEILTTQLADPKHVAGARAVYLVSDPDYLVLAVHGPANANLPGWAGGPLPNVQPASGLRSVPVDGMVYCFNRHTGKREWYNPVEHQQMIVSQFEELPAVLFTARYQVVNNQQMAGRAGLGMAMVAGMKQTAEAFAKHNGKRWYENLTLPNNMLFDSLTMDHRTGKVELAGQSFKVSLTATAK